MDTIGNRFKRARFPLSATPTGTAAALIAIMLWSTNALAATFALDGLGVVQVLALQFGGATATLAMLRALRSTPASGSIKEMQWSSLRSLRFFGTMAVGIVGLTGTIVLQYVAFATVPIIEANVLAYGWPLFAAIWAALTYRSRQTLIGVPLAMLGFAGVAIILVSGGNLGHGDGEFVGYVAAIASALCMTLYTVMSGRLRIPVDTVLLIATALGSVVALTLCITGLAPWQWGSTNLGAWAASVYAGVGPMAGGFYLWSRAMSGDGARRLAPLGYATPLASTVLLLLFGAMFTSGTMVGALLVLLCSVGVLVVSRQEHG